MTALEIAKQKGEATEKTVSFKMVTVKRIFKEDKADILKKLNESGIQVDLLEITSAGEVATTTKEKTKEGILVDVTVMKPSFDLSFMFK